MKDKIEVREGPFGSSLVLVDGDNEIVLAESLTGTMVDRFMYGIDILVSMMEDDEE